LSGTNYPAVQFTRNRSATGVSIQVTGAADLGFTPALPTSQSSIDLGNGLDLVTVRALQPVSSYATIFFKVTVTQP
jgi:hypothetical protein